MKFYGLYVDKNHFLQLVDICAGDRTLCFVEEPVIQLDHKESPSRYWPRLETLPGMVRRGRAVTKVVNRRSRVSYCCGSGLETTNSSSAGRRWVRCNLHRWLDSFESSFYQSQLDFVENCRIESETDLVLIQTF